MAADQGADEGLAGQFDLPGDLAYLNCAYMAPQPRAVTAAGERALRAKSVPTQIGVEDFFGPVEDLRALFADMIGADADGVAVIPSASYGIGTAAANLDVAAGERILVLDEQFPSNVYPWRRLADALGAQVDTVPRSSAASGGGGIDWTGALLGRLDADVAAVAVPQCHWTDGSVVDLVAVGAAARDVGSALVVDASQSLGAAPFDVGAIRPDFVVCVGYKWLFGPYGMALLWAAEDHRDGVPLEEGWITRAGAEDFSGLVDYVDDYAPGARRYDMGERSAFIHVAMLRAALGLLVDAGVGTVAATTGDLLDRVDDRAGDLDLAAVPADDRVDHLTGIELPDSVDRGRLAAALQEASVVVSLRGSSVRIAPHVYNTAEHVDRLFEVLEDQLP